MRENKWPGNKADGRSSAVGNNVVPHRPNPKGEMRPMHESVGNNVASDKPTPKGELRSPQTFAGMQLERF